MQNVKFSSIVEQISKGVSFKTLSHELKSAWRLSYINKTKDHERRVKQLNHKLFCSQKANSGRSDQGFIMAEDGDMGKSRGTPYMKVLGSKKVSRELEALSNAWHDIQLVQNQILPPSRLF